MSVCLCMYSYLCVSGAVEHWAVWWGCRGSGGCRWCIEAWGQSACPWLTLSKPAALFPCLLLSLSPQWPRKHETTSVCVCACVSKYVWLQEATENADWAVCMHVSIFVSLCLCMLILLCVCVWVWKWLSRRYWWHPFQHWFTTAETHKSLLSAALILSCSLCHSHSTCCHLAQLLMNLYTRRKWI